MHSITRIIPECDPKHLSNNLLLRKDSFGWLLVDVYNHLFFRIGAIEAELIDFAHSNSLSSLNRLAQKFLIPHPFLNFLQYLSLNRDSIFLRTLAYPYTLKTKYIYSPIRLFLNLNENCNYYCAHCLVNASRYGPQIPLDHGLRLIDEAYELGVPEISINGGEPFLYPSLDAIIERINSHSMSLTITTNGSRINEQKARYLKSLKRCIRYVHVSIEGGKKLTDEIRGTGAFKRAVRAIHLLHECDIEATAAITVTGLMIDNEKEVINELRENEISSICLSPIRPTGRAKGNDKIEMTVDEFRASARTIIQMAKEAGITVKKHKDYPDRFELAHIVGLRGCGAGTLYLSIGGDGRVYACNFLRNRELEIGKSVGSIYSDSLESFCGSFDRIIEESPQLKRIPDARGFCCKC